MTIQITREARTDDALAATEAAVEKVRTGKTGEVGARAEVIG